MELLKILCYQEFRVTHREKVFVSSVPELMGAYGAALFSLQQWEENEEVKSDVSLNGLLEVKTFTSTLYIVKGVKIAVR